MTKEFIKKEIIILCVLIAPIIYMLIVWKQIPEQVPIHFNLKGEADNYGSKYLFPLLHIGLYLLLLILPKIDPRKKNYEIFSSTYFKLRFVLILFFSVIIFLIITNGIGMHVNMERILVTGLLLLFTIMGNYLGNIRPNWFIGIRTPWTLENETVWKKTHFMAGKLWFWAGLAGLVLSFFLTGRILHYIIIAIVLIISITPLVYSFIIFKKMDKR